jgi:hypothetical protein
MSDPVYTSRSVVELVRGTPRRVRLEAGAEFETGVHGPIKHHFGLHNEPDLPLPVDFIVAATGA